MKKLLFFALITFSSLGIQLIGFLPWWSFLIAIFLLGLIIPFRQLKMPSFGTGFLSGFLLWIFATLFFEWFYSGSIMTKVTSIFELPYFILVLVIGILGGLLSGLALYSGELIMSREEGNLFGETWSPDNLNLQDLIDDCLEIISYGVRTTLDFFFVLPILLIEYYGNISNSF